GRRRHTSFSRDWSSDVCSSDLPACVKALTPAPRRSVRPALHEGGGMPAVPYCGPAPLPGAAIGAWNFDPLLLAALALAAWFLRPQPRASQAGLGLLVLAYVSPICSLSSGLFSVRAAHHLLVVYAAAPLLAGQLAR